ncbi:MAG: DUF4340 domain-containing protein [Thiohalocapsa sp.]
MQKRSLFALIAATLVFAAAAIYALASGDRAVSPEARPQLAFPDLAAHLGDLAWMRMSHGGMKADFNLIAGHWAVVEKGNYPAAAGKVRQLLLGLADLTLIEPKTARPELFARLDLDDPSGGRSTLIALQDRTGKSAAEVIVGKIRHDRLGGGTDGVYVRRPGDAHAWLARGSFHLPQNLLGWLDRRILDIPATQIMAVTLKAADGAVLSLRRDDAGHRFTVAEMPADAKLKPDVVAAPAAALAALDLDDVKPAAALPVPSENVATAAFTTFDGLTVTARLFSLGKVDWVALRASSDEAAEAAAAALNARLGRWVYAIPAARAQLLRTTLGDLLAPAGGS